MVWIVLNLLLLLVTANSTTATITTSTNTITTAIITPAFIINSFGAAGNYSQHRGLTPQATLVDNVPSAPVPTRVDILHANEIEHILHANGRSLLRTVAYFQKINWRKKS